MRIGVVVECCCDCLSAALVICLYLCYDYVACLMQFDVWFYVLCCLCVCCRCPFMMLLRYNMLCMFYVYWMCCLMLLCLYCLFVCSFALLLVVCLLVGDVLFGC